MKRVLLLIAFLFFGLQSFSQFPYADKMEKSLKFVIKQIAEKEQCKQVFFQTKVFYQMKFYTQNDFVRFLKNSDTVKEISFFDLIDRYFYFFDKTGKYDGLLKDFEIVFSRQFDVEGVSIVICNDIKSKLFEIHNNLIYGKTTENFEENTNWLFVKPCKPIYISENTLLIPVFIRKIKFYSAKDTNIFKGLNRYKKFYVFKLKWDKNKIQLVKQWLFIDGWVE